MAIPDFTQHGVLPEGVHPCTFDEVRDRFTYTPIREALFGKLASYRDWMCDFNVYRAIFIDGSFVTDKPNPGDVDVIVELPNDLTLLNGEARRALDNSFLKNEFHLDVYPYHPNIGPHDFTLFFQYLRDQEATRRGLPIGSRKGLLRVAL